MCFLLRYLQGPLRWCETPIPSASNAWAVPVFPPSHRADAWSRQMGCLLLKMQLQKKCLFKIYVLRTEMWFCNPLPSEEYKISFKLKQLLLPNGGKNKIILYFLWYMYQNLKFHFWRTVGVKTLWAWASTGIIAASVRSVHFYGVRN